MERRTIRAMLAADLQDVKEIDRVAFSPEERYGDDVFASMLSSGHSLAAESPAGVVVGYAFVHGPQELHPSGDGFGYVRSG